MTSNVTPSFLGKVAIVTGAAHGFGRSISIELAKRGAKVIAVDINEQELIETLHSINQGAQFEGCGWIRKVDVTNDEEVRSCVQWVRSEVGKIDILVNNAGGVLGQIHKPIEQISTQEWTDILNVNLSGAFFFIRSVAPHMKERKYGRIINVSSGAGRSFSLTGIQAYSSAKAGQIGLTRQMARELGPYNITVNNVAPGFVRSNPATERQWQAMGEKGQQELLQSVSLKRLGLPEDIAHAVLFFASDYANYISGQVISVDGGTQLF